MQARDWTRISWREQTWGERAQYVMSTTLALFIGLALFGVGVYIAGGMAEGYVRYHADHVSCLKHATTGYEIKQCR